MSHVVLDKTIRAFSGSQTLAWICLTLAALFLGIGYATQDAWWAVAVLFCFELLWVWGLAKQVRWACSIGFAGNVLLAASGIWFFIPAYWTLTGLIWALSAWDLADFTWRMKQAGRVEARPGLEYRHYRRLLTLNLLSIFLVWVALGSRLQFGFGITMLLSLLAIIGLSLGIRSISAGSR